MRKLHESGSERINVRIPKNYAEALKRLCTEGKTLSDVVREALDRFFGIAAVEPPKQESAGMMFRKKKWQKGAK